MTTWTSEELNKFGNAEELQIITMRRDGTLRKPVTIWVVRVVDELYVRSWRGHNGAWFRGTQERQEGRIEAGGIEKDVSFVAEEDPAINNLIDTAYRNKYKRHSTQYVDPMVAPTARATTIKLVPRATRT